MTKKATLRLFVVGRMLLIEFPVIILWRGITSSWKKTWSYWGQLYILTINFVVFSLICDF